MEQFDFDLTNMGDYRLIPQLVERVNEQMRIEGEKFICERLMDLQIDKDILLNQTQEIRRLNGILQEIKDKQEQGLLIELPCKVGDTVFQIHTIPRLGAERKVIVEVETDVFFLTLCVMEGRFGKTVFLTRSEAEEALAKMGE